jgi:hypothetical protein
MGCLKHEFVVIHWMDLTPQVVHDYQHLGVTNDFLIATQDPLAVLYNDRCAAALGIASICASYPLVYAIHSPLSSKQGAP